MELRLHKTSTTTFHGVLLDLTLQRQLHRTINNGMLCDQTGAKPNEILTMPANIHQDGPTEHTLHSATVISCCGCWNMFERSRHHQLLRFPRSRGHNHEDNNRKASININPACNSELKPPDSFMRLVSFRSCEVTTLQLLSDTRSIHSYTSCHAVQGMNKKHAVAIYRSRETYTQGT
jgi:hypothetical protein